MLTIADRMSQIRFSELMDVYKESNILNAMVKYPDISSDRQLLEAEQDFYHYLHSVFFKQKDSFCAIWEAAGSYQAALRIEPYADGYLLCALETKQTARHRGYASALLLAVQNYLAQKGSGILYSHISRNNTASLNVHRKCSFQIIKDYAVYIDGSVLSDSVTLAYPYKKTET